MVLEASMIVYVCLQTPDVPSLLTFAVLTTAKLVETAIMYPRDGKRNRMLST